MASVVLNMVTQLQIQTFWQFGRLNLVTSLTEQPPLSIIILFQEKASGVSNQVWSSTYHTEWMDKVLNIVLVDWKDSYKCQMITATLIFHWLMNNNLQNATFKLLPVQTLPTFSMFWEDNWEEITENPWLISIQRNCWNSKQ